MAPDIEFVDVRKRYRVYHERYRSLKEVVFNRGFGSWEERWALDGVSFEVEPGATFGLIGPNGAGKSTSLKLMGRILEPDGGDIRVRRRLAGLLELGAGFQPEYTGRENVYLNASLLGLTRQQIDARFDSIVDFAELGPYIDSALRTYSSGMHMRLGFSVAIHVDAEILLVDEILAVGDVSFQRKCYDWLEDFRSRGGTIVIVSHSLDVVRQRCDRVAWIEAGRLMDLGPADGVVAAYLRSAARESPDRPADRAPERRPGAAVELGAIRLVDPDGGPVRAVEQGGTVRLEIGYSAGTPHPDPVFGVGIFTLDQTEVFSTDTATDRLALGPVAGPGAVVLELRDVALRPGGYSVEVWVGEGPARTQRIDAKWLDNLLRVAGDGGEPGSRGLVELPHAWKRCD